MRWDHTEEQSRDIDFYLNVDQDTGESSKKRSDPINVKIQPYKGFTGLTGLKNTVKI